MIAIYIGPPKSGKSYVAVNSVLKDCLIKTDRQIWHNLPIVQEWLVTDFARGAVAQTEMRKRLHELRDVETMAFDPETGNQLGLHHMVREWWYFVAPGSLVLIDECGEVWPSSERKRPELMASLLNRHAHFGFDVILFAHRSGDLDIQVRSKAEAVFYIANSLRESIFPGVPLVQAVKWPLQFFMIRQYLASEVLERTPGSTVRCQDSFNVFPKARGFKNYRSFSHASNLPWLKPKAEALETMSYSPTFWGRMRAQASAYRRIVILALAVVVALIVAWRLMLGLAHMGNTKSIAKFLGTKDGTNGPTLARPVTAVASNGLPAESRASASNAVPVAERKREMVVFACPEWFRTSGGTKYAVGDSIAGLGVVRRVLLDGVELESGKRVRFNEFL